MHEPKLWNDKGSPYAFSTLLHDRKRTYVPCWNATIEFKQTWENWHSNCENWQSCIQCELTAARPYNLSCALVYITAAVCREDLRPVCSVCCICANPCHLCSRSRIAPADLMVCSIEVFALCCWFSGKLPTVARPSLTCISFPTCNYNPHAGLGADFY